MNGILGYIEELLFFQLFRKIIKGVPATAQWKRTQLVAMKMRVQSLASLSRLRIWCCCGCGVGWLLYNKVTHIHIYTFFISYHLPSCSIPVLYSRTSLLIHSKCNSLHLPIPKSQSMLPPPSAPRQPQVCSLCLGVCSVLQIGSFVLYLPYFILFVFLGSHSWHMEVPRLGVESEPQLLAYTTATATWDPSRICDLHHSPWQCRIPNPLSKARNRICVLMDASQVH